MAVIAEKRDLTPITSLFEVDAPLVSRNAQPGQFVMVRTHDHGERIPVTITDFDRQKGTITLVVQEVGKTTRDLRSLGKGDTILDFVGPLGRPVALPDSGHVVLIGGGFGAGAILTIAKELKRRGVQVSSIVGARNSELVILDEEVDAASDNMHICTDDGSRGYHGFVTTQL